MQENWIGRSDGAEVEFKEDDSGEPIRVFTTRVDTIFGATFMVLAPEHPLLETIVPEAWPAGTNESWTAGAGTPRDAVAAYRREASRKSDVERQAGEKGKSGVFTGAFATNPVTGRAVPVFVADYVLMGYGTGAIMAVPAQDERDWEFAQARGLDIVRTVQPSEGHPEDQPYTGQGAAINSSTAGLSLDGLDIETAKTKVIEWLEANERGTGTTTYRLRDWLFSRQRYWGEPFPIVYDEDGTAHALPM